MNNIVIELCAEDRARLDRIALLLEKLTAAPAAPASAPAPEAKPISLGEFQKAITKRCVESAEVKQKVVALVKSYAASVSAIPEDKRAEVLAALADL